MTRNLSLTLLLAASACSTNSGTTPGTDELAGENGQDGNESKADSPHDNFTYVAVEKQGAFNCNNPLTCTPYQLTRLNRAQMVCNDDKLHDNCMVKAVSFSAFSQDGQDKLNAAIQREAEDPSIGVQVIVKGQFKIYVDFLAFEASEAWIAQLDGGSADGTWVRISDNGLRCFGNCKSTLEERLNSNRSAMTNGLDFGQGFDQKLQIAIGDQRNQPDGVIVVGSRSYGVGEPNSYQTTLRTVDQAFLPVN